MSAGVGRVARRAQRRLRLLQLVERCERAVQVLQMTAEEPEHTRKASSRLGICTHLLADHVKKGLRLRCARLHAILGDHEP